MDRAIHSVTVGYVIRTFKITRRSRWSEKFQKRYCFDGRNTFVLGATQTTDVFVDNELYNEYIVWITQ